MKVPKTIIFANKITHSLIIKSESDRKQGAWNNVAPWNIVLDEGSQPRAAHVERGFCRGWGSMERRLEGR